MNEMVNTTTAWLIFFAAIFAHNILLVYFLGMCSFLACSRQYRTALGLGAAVTFVMTATAVINHLIYTHVLVPWELGHLKLIVFIAVVAAFVQLVEMIIERISPPLYYTLGIFLPLITVNCAILGVGLFMLQFHYSLWQATWYGLGSGLGWTLAITLMAGLRHKMGYANIPPAFQGLAITMIVTGIMALAFMGFAGMASLQ